LATARDYLDAARREVEGNKALGGNPAISLMVHAAIAFTDAVTATHKGQVNQQDHANAVNVLRDALGSRLPKDQVNKLTRILAEKDAAEYSPRRLSMDEARKLLVHLESYADWAESMTI